MMGYIHVCEHFGGGRHIDAEESDLRRFVCPGAGFQDICMASVLFFVLDLVGFSDAPTFSLYT